MKKLVKVSVFILATSFVSLNSTSFADNSSPFYKNMRYRAYYNELSLEQQNELDRMNTDGKAPLSLKELRDSGKYSLPIVKGTDWLYPFMDDRDNDGMVGEAGDRYLDSDASSSDSKVSDDKINLVDDLDNNPSNPSDELDDNKKEDTKTSTEKKPVSEDTLRRYRRQRDKLFAKVEVVEYMMLKYPNTYKSVEKELKELLQEAKDGIARADKILARFGY